MPESRIAYNPLPVSQPATPEQRRLRLFIAEDDNILCRLLLDLLGSDFDIVGTASNGEQALSCSAAFRFDILLLDISMPLLSGLAVAQRLRDDGNPIPIIFVTEHAEQGYFTAARQVGARGYVLKRCATAELPEAIHSVAAGNTFVSPSIRSRYAVSS